MAENLFTPEKQRQFVQDEMDAWLREDVIPTLRTAINRRKEHIPIDENDMNHQIVTGLGEALGMYTLGFPDEGRHVDMKRLRWKKAPIQQGNNFILEWVKKRGRSAFKQKVPGYKNRPKKLSEGKQMERIASAIIAAKASNTRYVRRGRWYNSTINQLISRLTVRLTVNQAEWIQGVSRAEIEKAFTMRVGTVTQRVKFK